MKKYLYIIAISLLWIVPYKSRAQSPADAGPDQHVCAASTYLDAVHVEDANDEWWTVIDGHGTFEDSHDPHTKVTALDTDGKVSIAICATCAASTKVYT